MEFTYLSLGSFQMSNCEYDMFKRLKKLDPNLALAYIEAIMEYGFKRKEPDKDSPLWLYGLSASFALIDGTIEKEVESRVRVEDKNKKVEDKKLNKMNKLELEKIASLVLQKYTQQEIGKKLGISQQIVSYRLGVIRSEYPELLSNANTK